MKGRNPYGDSGETESGWAAFAPGMILRGACRHLRKTDRVHPWQWCRGDAV